MWIGDKSSNILFSTNNNIVDRYFCDGDFYVTFHLKRIPKDLPTETFLKSIKMKKNTDNKMTIEDETILPSNHKAGALIWSAKQHLHTHTHTTMKKNAAQWKRMKPATYTMKH